MCQGVVELRKAVCDYGARFDARVVSGEDAAVVVAEAAVIERAAATLKALAAARVADTSRGGPVAGRFGARELAKTSGTSLADAAKALDLAHKLSSLPETAAAARRGEISPSQAAAVAAGAGADPGAERRLVEMARRSSLRELQDEAARVRAGSQSEDAEARRRRIHDRRSLRSWTDGEGTWHLHATNNPEVGARVMAAIDTKRDEIFKGARAEGRREPLEAYGADALEALVTGGAPTTPKSSARAKILVRVDLAALLRGRPLGEEICEICGCGPVAVSAVKEMIASGNPFLVAIATDGHKVTGVAHLGRSANAFEQSALEWLYPTCAAEGCSAVARLENDHRHDWAKTHITAFDGLDRLCAPMHDLKTRHGWALVAGTGKRAFVAPSDPRHPANANQRERPPPQVA